MMDAAYDPKKVEERIYKFWMDGGWFHSEVDETKKPFVIMMPLPNVTGVLHTGHALNNSFQDCLTRYHRMKGENALYLPGQDHAGVATQIVVEKELYKTEKKSRFDIGREAFVKKVWEWKEQKGQIILGQQKRLGISPDWERFTFTMDEGYQKAVRETFCHYYEKGYIYRGKKVINWCPHCRTVISDIEVEHEDKDSHLWHIRYPFKDNLEDGLIVATTRPETMLGDIAVAVNPNDDRYKNLVGKTVILPVANREIKIIADEYVDMEFGTGCVKITPAHDFNDFEVGKRHNLEMPIIMGPDGKMVNVPEKYVGLPMLEARDVIIKELEELGLLIKIEDHKNAVGRHDKCKTTVEPLLSDQLFLSMKKLAEPAVEEVKNGQIKFIPDRWSKVYFDWMENILDWPISRQCWWGHRIPIFYCDSCGYEFVSRTDVDKCPKCGGKVRQDEDCLDTWFSSAIWPFATLGWPEKTKELAYYYPGTVLLTGYDIIFFWVARMIFSGLEFMDKKPFEYVYMTGLIRDEKGRKMSKSLQNAIDPMDVIEKFGTDALRFTLAYIATQGGQDINLGDRVLTEGRNFINKLWNASRFTIMNLEGFTDGKIENPNFADRWILSKTNEVITEVTKCLDEYDISKGARVLFDFFWSDFCDWYIELSKLPLQQEESKLRTQRVLYRVLDATLKMLHPITPFVTEEIWQKLPHQGETIMTAKWPVASDFMHDQTSMDEMATVQSSIKAIRNLKAQLRVHAALVPCSYWAPENEKKTLEREKDSITKLARVEGFGFSETKPEGCVVAVSGQMKFFLDLADRIDIAEEKKRVQNNIEKNRAELAKIDALLGNPDFVKRAPDEIIEKNEDKKAELVAELANLDELLGSLSL